MEPAVPGAAVAPNIGGGPKPRSYLPLTYYWDEVDAEPGTWDASARDREAVTAGVPPPTATPAGSLRPAQHEQAITVPTPGPSAVGIFWWALLALVVVGMLLTVLGSRGSDGLVIGVIILLLVLPGLQLGAAFLTALVLALSPRPDKGYQFRQLGKIVLGSVVGAVAGILVMVGLYYVLAHR